MDFSNINQLPWLIPVGPLLAFLVIVLLTNRAQNIPATDHAYSGDGHHPDYDGMLVPVVQDWSRVLSIIVGVSGIIAAWLISFTVVQQALGVHHLGEGENILASSVDWMSTGMTTFKMGVLVDPLTTVMLFMVPLACTMIFIYAIGYMAHDPRQARFFAYISLFAGAMLTLVVADNLLLLFVGWEIMGLCSFLLIGFWYEKHTAYKAAVKAFTTTRIADVLMLLGIAYLYAATGTLNFREINNNPEVLSALANTPAIIFGTWGVSAATLIGIFLIIGTVGKSAQFPLHVWLPDAMEGPTPVSAMIHAAAMVSAGIYAVIRMYPVFEAGGHPHDGEMTTALLFLAVVGSITALFAATIAVAQNDVKKVLAYSTISQLGFMVAILGLGGFVPAFFHLITHAFFKALLFMASGSVIHGMEHGHHHVHTHGHDEHDVDVLGAHGGGGGNDSHSAHAHGHDAHGHDTHGHADHSDHSAHTQQGEHEAHGHHSFDPQDMLNMGGLRKTMPVTFITFLIGGLSLAGFPLITAGFWSKDEILAEAYKGMSQGYGAHALVFICLALAAFLTAFYTARQLCLTFMGDARTEPAKHANLGQGIVSITMTLPLIILAFFAVTAGFVGVPSDFPVLGAIFSPEYNWFHHFVAPTFLSESPTLKFNIVPVLVSVFVALGGLGLGWWVYGRKPLVAGQADPLVEVLGALHGLLKNKYYLDELYTLVFIKPMQWFSKNVASDFLDKGVIDGFLHLLARVFNFIGDLFKTLNAWLIDGVGDGVPQGIGAFGIWLKRIQTGRVQQYLLLVLLAALIIGVVFAVSAGVRAAG